MAEPLRGYRIPSDLRRRERLACSFTKDELADLRAIAEAWGVAPALVVWSFVQSALAECRGEAPSLGKHGLAIAAAQRVLRQGGKGEAGEGEPW